MKKLLARLKKIFASSKGFTLIELLVVIAIVGVLLAGTIVAINPAQKINQAKDANGKAAVDQISSAMQAYYTTNTYYPAVVVDLVGTTNELRSEPKDPDGNSFSVAKNPAACTTAAKDCTDLAVYFTLKAPAVATDVVWCWRSSQGVAKAMPLASCTAP